MQAACNLERHGATESAFREEILLSGSLCRNGRQGSTALVVCLIVLSAFSILMLSSEKASATPWVLEAVDYIDNVGQHPSLAIGNLGDIHIAYYDISYRRLKYALWDGGNWQLSVVDSSGDVGNGASLALNSSGYPHISYLNSTGYDLKHAFFNGTAWSIETVDASGTIGGETSIAIDSMDYPHISYHKDDKIMYAAWNGTDWALEQVANGDREMAIAIDSADIPHIAYFTAPYYFLYVKYASRTAGSWQTENITSGGDKGYDIALAIDDADDPHLAFGYGRNNGVYPEGLQYANWTGGAWNIQLLEYTPSAAWWLGDSVSIALDAAGNPHIAYSGISRERHSWWNVSKWEFEDVDPVFAWWWGTSIGIDGSGCPHISHARWTGPPSDSDLVHATRCSVNLPPLKPTQPSGPTSGLVSTQYSYSTNTTDPENSTIRYVFDWGDGTKSYSDRNDSGVQVTMSHTWASIGNFSVRAIALDNNSALSEWSNTTYVNVYTIPGQPRSLRAAANDSRIFLSWMPPLSDGGSPVSNYRIYRGSTTGGEVFLSEIGNLREYNDTGLTNGSTYYYTVSAVNLAGEGPQSTEINATPARPPGPPQGLVATPSSNTVDLQWAYPLDDGGLAATNFTVYRGLSSGVANFKITLGNVTTYRDAGLTNGVTYYYSVTCHNPIGESPKSNETNATPATTPSEPLNLMAFGGIGQITLVWLAPSDSGGFPIANYTVFRGLSPGSENLLVTLANVTGYSDTGLTSGQRYFYQVSANSSIGEGPRSNEASAATAKVPSKPQNLMATSGNARATLSWSPPADEGGSPVTNYTIYRGIVSGSRFFLKEIGNALSYIDIGLTNGQTYYYELRARNAVGEGLPSDEANATPMPVLPGVPRNIIILDNINGLTLAWSPPADDGGSPVSGYRIYRGVNGAPATPYVTLGTVGSFRDTGVRYPNEYLYRISAINSVGEGLPSSPVSTMPIMPPFPPAILEVFAEDSRVTLNWSEPSESNGAPVQDYTIYRGTTPGSETPYAVRPRTGPSETFTDSGLMNGVTYHYYIRARNIAGLGNESNNVSATPGTIPTEPLNLKASAGIASISISWNRPIYDGGLEIDSYLIHRGNLSGGEAFLAEVGNQLTYVDTGVVNGQRYFYMVAAKNAKGTGPLSNEASAVPFPQPTPPSPPRNLRASAGNKQVALQWDEPVSNGGSQIIGYNVYSGTTSWNKVFSAGLGVVLGHVDGSLVNGQTYYYQVTALNAYGEGVLSNEASARPLARPGQPLNLGATSGNKWVTLHWNAPTEDGGSPIMHYNVYRAEAGGGKTFIGQVEGALTFGDSDLVNGRTYVYSVAAVNAVGEGDSSAGVAATPSNSLPDCNVAVPAPEAIVSGTVSIEGSASDSDGTVRSVQIKIDDGEWIDATGTTSWTYTWDTMPLPDGNHHIRVRSFDGEDNSFECALSVTIRNTARQDDGTGTVLVGAMLVLAAVLGVYIIMRRRGRIPKDPAKEGRER